MDFDEHLSLAMGLEGQLYEYATSPGFERRLERAMGELHELEPDNAWSGAVETILFDVDRSGREPLLQRYLRANKQLPDQARAIYGRWLDGNVPGLFRVRKREGTRLELSNLLDDLEYTAYSDADPAAVEDMRKNDVMTARLLPVDDVWLLAGRIEVLPAKSRDELRAEVLLALMARPWLPYRNPDLLRVGREQSRRHHDQFIQRFGSSVVRGTGADALEAYRQFTADCLQAENPAAYGPDKARQLAEEGNPDDSFPDKVSGAQDVALHHHPLQSVTFAVDYTLAEQAHREPPRSADEPTARVIDGYLHDPAIPPYLLEELAAAHPDTVDDLYRVVLDRPGFRWEDDGEALLHRLKHHQYPHLDVPALFVKPRILAHSS